MLFDDRTGIVNPNLKACVGTTHSLRLGATTGGEAFKVRMGPTAFSTAVLSLSVIRMDFSSKTVPNRGAGMAATCRRCTSSISRGITRIVTGLAH